MKIAVSSTGENLNSPLDPRFGRCSYFLVINPDDMSFEVVKNDSAILGGGAGIQAAQTLASKGVHAVLTGNCGPKAVQTLSAAGIELYMGQTGTVKEVVERFRNENITPTSDPNVSSHFGMGDGGDGFGPGRSMGGRGLYGQNAAMAEKSGGVSKNNGLEMLKDQADKLNKQIEDIIFRINKLEKSD